MAKWWDGTRNWPDCKKKINNKINLFFSFLARLVYSQISLLSQLTASPTNPRASVRKRMGISKKRLKPKHLFWQQPTLQADKAQSQNQLIRMISELCFWQNCVFKTGIISCICIKWEYYIFSPPNIWWEKSCWGSITDTTTEVVWMFFFSFFFLLMYNVWDIIL